MFETINHQANTNLNHFILIIFEIYRKHTNHKIATLYILKGEHIQGTTTKIKK